LDALRARGLDELAGRLTGYAARLGKLEHDACVAGAPPERMACFEICKTSLRAITTSLGDAEPAAAWHRVAALPPPEACRSDEALRLSPIGPAHQALMEKLARSSFDVTVSLDDLVAQAESARDTAAQLQIALVRARRTIDEDRGAA